MRVRSFPAKTVAEAITLARAAMGDDARLLATRTTDRGVELVVAEPAPAGAAPPAGPRRATPGAAEVEARLRRSGVASWLADRVLEAASTHRGLAALDAAAAALADEIPVLLPGGRKETGRPRIVALVGPTGVG